MARPEPCHDEGGGNNSDVESSLRVERDAVTRQPAPISDVETSLRVAHDSTARLLSLKNTRGLAWGRVGAGASLLLVALAISSLLFIRRHGTRRRSAIAGAPEALPVP